MILAILRNDRIKIKMVANIEFKMETLFSNGKSITSCNRLLHFDLNITIFLVHFVAFY